MDPNQTVRDITYACQSQDWTEARSLLLLLREWLNKGGFAPDIALSDPTDASMKDAPASVLFMLSQLRKRITEK